LTIIISIGLVLAARTGNVDRLADVQKVAFKVCAGRSVALGGSSCQASISKKKMPDRRKEAV
jgi:hypothetical protein